MLKALMLAFVGACVLVNSCAPSGPVRIKRERYPIFGFNTVERLVFDSKSLSPRYALALWKVSRLDSTDESVSTNMAFGLIQRLAARGWLYTRTLDSAQAIVAISVGAKKHIDEMPLAPNASTFQFFDTGVVRFELSQLPSCDSGSCSPSYPYLYAIIYSAKGDLIKKFEEYRSLPKSDWRFGVGASINDFLTSLPVGFRSWISADSGKIGIGIDFNTSDGKGWWPSVSEVEAGSAAAEAGIHVGDLLLAEDGVSFDHTSIADVRDLLKGPPGRKLSLTVSRCGQGSLSYPITMRPRQKKAVSKE